MKGTRVLAIAWLGASAACAAELEQPERFEQCSPGRVEQLFVDKCGDCHGGSEPDANLDLVSPGVAARVTGTASATDQCEGQFLIATTDQTHLMLDKISGRPSCGNPMPLGLPALSSTDIECVRRWIDGSLAAEEGP